MNFLKNKRFILVASAIVFLTIVFFFKTGNPFKNENKTLGIEVAPESNETLESLINKDTDGDGVLDWEEGLWGTDATIKDTDGDGILDSEEISELKKKEIGNTGTEAEPVDEENLTETDKFSREFFSTVATLNQVGEIDQATVDKLSSSIADQIKNTVPEKVYTSANIKVSNVNTKETFQKYSDNLDAIYKKYPIKKGVTAILQEFLVDEDVTILNQLDSVITQMSKIINETLKVNTPSALATLHLNFINSLQRLTENLDDIQLFDTDVIIALGAISQYDANLDNLDEATNNLLNAINQKLNN